MLEGTEDVPGLRHIPDVEVYVDMEDLTYKDLIIAMGIKGIEYADCAQKYMEHGVTIFERVKSSPYSKRIVETLGLDGALRVSPLHCHGRDDVDKFLKITKDIDRREITPIPHLLNSEKLLSGSFSFCI